MGWEGTAEENIEKYVENVGVNNIALLLHLQYGITAARRWVPSTLDRRWRQTLRGTSVELHNEGRAIRFRALEFTLHPDAVHLQLPLAVHEHPTVDTKLHNGEQRVG
jgi:hypothetical protein